MRVGAPSISVDDRLARLCAMVESESQAFEPFELVIGVPRQYVGWLDPSGNAFVPTLLLLAGVLSEPLKIEAAVSCRLLAGVKQASKLYHEWWQVPSASIGHDGDADAARPFASCSGLFFTRGVDSWFSALRAQRGQLSHQITHLLYAADFDHQYTASTRTLAVRATQEAADRLGLPLVPINHNGRDLLDRFVNWERSHGAVLAGIGLALGRGLRRAVIASSYDHSRLMPWGSHPQLDPLWSTEKTRIYVDGVETARTEKVSAIARSPLALPRLKVCWQADTNTNCGRCEKCSRTQIAIQLARAEIPEGVFENSLRLDDLPALELASAKPCRRVFWEELLEYTEEQAEFSRWHFKIKEELAPQDTQFPAIHVPAGAAVGLLPHSIAKRLPSEPKVYEANSNVAGAIEVTWGRPEGNRVAMPLRPTSDGALELLRSFRRFEARPVAWCVIDRPSPESAALVKWLCDSWGPGLSAFSEDEPHDGDCGTPLTVAEAIQRRSQVRCWFNSSAYLDPFRVLATLMMGCLPQLFVPAEVYEELRSQLPAGLDAFLQSTDLRCPVAPLELEEVEAKLDRGLSVLLRGSFERDLDHALTLARAA